VSLIGKLQKDDNLPVVAFTFSRNRCDDNADSMTTTDLLTSSEKSAVHVFFQNSVKRLKGSDSKLPQVRGVACMCAVHIGQRISSCGPFLQTTCRIFTCCA